MSSRKNRPHKKTADNNIEQLKHQMQKNDLLSNDRVVLEDTKGPKISAVFLKFIKPYEKDAPTDDAFEKLLAIAAIAWNATISDRKESKHLIDATVSGIAKTAGKESGEDTREIIAMLMRRKEKFFADDKRYIVDCRVSKSASGLRHLAVAAFIKSNHPESLPVAKTRNLLDASRVMLKDILAKITFR